MRKGMKKFLSLLCALAIIATCMATTWDADAATGSGAIEITNVQSDAHTYYAYQIFAGTTSGTTLSDITWGDGVNPDLSTYGTYSSIYAALANISVTIDNSTVYPFKVNNESNGANLSSAADVAAALDTYSYTAVLEAFAAMVENYLTNTYTQNNADPSTASDGTYTYKISDLASGYYLVVDKTNSGYLPAGDVITSNIVKVVEGKTTSTVTKEVAPSVSKTIVTNSGDAYATSASAGNTVTFKLTGTLPSDLSSYVKNNQAYTFTFNDTLSENLIYTTGSIKVVLTNGTNEYTLGTSAQTDQTPYCYAYYALATGTSNAYETLTINISNLATSSESYGGYTIYVTYEATLKTTATAGTVENNKVTLTYSNDPSATTTSTTPEKTVYVHTFDLNVYKTDSSDPAAPLAGAKFTLYKKVTVNEKAFNENKTSYYTYTDSAKSMTQCNNSNVYDSGTSYYVVAVAETEAAGNATDGYKAAFSDLGEGTYILVESTTPTGYNTAEAIVFTISATYSDDGSTVKNLTTNSTAVAAKDSSTSTLTSTIKNSAGSELPETGGIGTTLFYIIGGILVLGAAILLITKRLMRKEEQ